MAKTNQDIIGEQWINNYDGVGSPWWRQKNNLENLSWEAFENKVRMG